MKHLLFVDDEPKVLQGLERQLRGMRNDWTMEFAANGAKAMEIMENRPVDVIVTDMIMPGMDGAQLLAEVVKRHPKTVRIVLSGHADRDAVLRLVEPAHQYLSKPCDPEELRRAIGRAFALRELLANERLKQLATRLGSLPTLPALHTQLTDELRKDEPSLDRVTEIISKDIGMTSKVLQLVNSAFFGLPQPVSSAHEAVMYLGLTTVRALVLSIQLFSQYDSKKLKGFSLDDLTQHCWMTGTFARCIAEAEHSDGIDDQCFLGGLLHDVGRLILASGLPDEYAEVLASTRARGWTVLEAEQAKFGASHAEVGAYLLGLWGLPNPIIEAVALHHRPMEASCESFSAVIAVHVANAFAHDLSGSHLKWPGSQIDMDALSRAGLAGRLDAWRERCLAEKL